MIFFTSGLFWFLEGIMACLMVIGFKVWTEDRGIPMPPWKWILFGLWACFAAFTIAFVGTSIGESEMDAAVKGGILFGVISVITAVGFWRFLLRGTGSDSA
jgi:hypothetical protein